MESLRARPGSRVIGCHKKQKQSTSSAGLTHTGGGENGLECCGCIQADR